PHSARPMTTLELVRATRSYRGPEAVCTRLEALYTRQPPMTTPRLDAALRSAFPQGLPFSKFDRRPIAVGSIAQVHRAELVNGERVIVKLVRPGLQREIDRDLNAAELLVDQIGRAHV